MATLQLQSMPSLALKEWAIALQALTQGESILLLRKGGIREKSFALPQSRFWLYPTYEHQQPHLLKPQYADQVQPVPSGWHPETVEISAWAELTHCWEVDATAQLDALLPFHIWNAQFVTERLNWKPHVPLLLLLVRVYCLAQPQVIHYHSEYGGCKSWIELQMDVAGIINTSQPVLPEATYLDHVKAIASHRDPKP
jgi:hypothetical protein